MKQTITIAAIFFSINLFAQNQYNFIYDRDIRKSEYSPIHYTPIIPVKSISFKVVKTKNGKAKLYSKKFNSNGKLTEFNRVDDVKKSTPIVTMEYDSNGDLLIAKSFKKGMLKSTTTYTRTKKGAPLSQKKVKSNGKTALFNTWEYNSDGCILKSINYKKGSENANKKWEYEYYDKCKQSKTTLYNKKNKVINIWSFDCKEEGDKLKKKKDLTQICRWEESSTKFLVKTYQSFDEKGKIRKHVSQYTLEDTLLVASKTYNENEQLIREATYNNSNKFPLRYISYKKGKITYEYAYKYDDELTISTSFSYKGKLHNKSEYLYNEKKLLVEVKRYNRKDEVYQTIKLAYRY